MAEKRRDDHYTTTIEIFAVLVRYFKRAIAAEEYFVIRMRVYALFVVKIAPFFYRLEGLVYQSHVNAVYAIDFYAFCSLSFHTAIISYFLIAVNQMSINIFFDVKIVQNYNFKTISRLNGLGFVFPKNLYRDIIRIGNDKTKKEQKYERKSI